MNFLRSVLVVIAASAIAYAAEHNITADQQTILNATREYASHYVARLPDFICTQVTDRDSKEETTRTGYYAGLGAPRPGEGDEVIEKVTYVGGKEEYEVITINGKKAEGTTHEQLEGATSMGEFGSTLSAIFGSDTHTEFSWKGTAQVRGRRANIFNFVVPKEGGIHVTSKNTGEDVQVGYHGQIFIDAQTNEVMRVVSHVDLPHGFPIQSAYRMVEYAPVTIAGQSYNLPAHAEVSMDSGTYSYTNKVSFKDFHEFKVQSTIHYGSLPPPAATEAAVPPSNAAQTPVPPAPPVVAARQDAANTPAPTQPALPPATESAVAAPHNTPAPVAATTSAPPAPPTAVETHQIASAAPAPTPVVPPAASAEPRPDTATTFNLKFSTDLVLVPVVVRDSSGHAVSGLSKEDFHIFDKGKQQDISSFMMEVEPSGMPGGGTPPVPGQQQTAVPISQLNYTVYLIDDMHLTSEDLVRVRQAAQRQIGQLAAADRVAIITTSGLVVTPLTNDREKLNSALMGVRAKPVGAGSGQICPDIDYYIAYEILHRPAADLLPQAAIAEAMACLNLSPSQPGAADIASRLVAESSRRAQQQGEQETRAILLQIKDVVRWLAKAPGTRNIILVSPGFFIEETVQFDASDVLEEAIRSQVVINTLDALGVGGWNPVGNIEEGPHEATFARVKASLAADEGIANSTVMLQFADGTGGDFFHNSNDLFGGFVRLSARPEYTYLIGFKPAAGMLDGRFHPLTVKLNRKGNLSVQARRGYFAAKR